ncbi:MAG: MalY/PatB family protein [Acidimicrobiia bacterium]
MLPLWIAEPYLPLAPVVVETLQKRAADGWYGYEVRPPEVTAAFWGWMARRHGWDRGELETSPSPSVGTSIATLIDFFSEPGDGVILQPPVFSEFKPLIRRSKREPVRNSLVLEEGRYAMDLDDLTTKASDPSNKLMILCNPHNPVGRVWERTELEAVATICADNNVFLISDEVHIDLALSPNKTTPLATILNASKPRWAAIHSPIKTFGLAGIADTYLITDDVDLAGRFRTRSARFGLTRNNVFSLAATKAAYDDGDDWVDQLLDQTAKNVEILDEDLPNEVHLIRPEATYLAWLDFTRLGMDVPELSAWLGEEAGLALSPGHWFGREGAGFARMTIAAERAVVAEAGRRIKAAVRAGAPTTE